MRLFAVVCGISAVVRTGFGAGWCAQRIRWLLLLRLRALRPADHDPNAVTAKCFDGTRRGHQCHRRTRCRSHQFDPVPDFELSKFRIHATGVVFRRRRALDYACGPPIAYSDHAARHAEHMEMMEHMRHGEENRLPGCTSAGLSIRPALCRLHSSQEWEACGENLYQR